MGLTFHFGNRKIQSSPAGMECGCCAEFLMGQRDAALSTLYPLPPIALPSSATTKPSSTQPTQRPLHDSRFGVGKTLAKKSQIFDDCCLFEKSTTFIHRPAKNSNLEYDGLCGNSETDSIKTAPLTICKYLWEIYFRLFKCLVT